MVNYKQKYLKYKMKYLKLKSFKGGTLYTPQQIEGAQTTSQMIENNAELSHALEYFKHIGDKEKWRSAIEKFIDNKAFTNKYFGLREAEINAEELERLNQEEEETARIEESRQAQKAREKDLAFSRD